MVFVCWCDVILVQWYKETFKKPQQKDKVNTIMELRQQKWKKMNNFNLLIIYLKGSSSFYFFLLKYVYPKVPKVKTPKVQVVSLHNVMINFHDCSKVAPAPSPYPVDPLPHFFKK